MATQAQVAYLTSLATRLGMDRLALRARLDLSAADRIEYYVSRTDASVLIDALRAEVDEMDRL